MADIEVEAPSIPLSPSELASTSSSLPTSEITFPSPPSPSPPSSPSPSPSSDPSPPPPSEGYNPHAAIIARHAARKAEKEKAEREERELIEKIEREKDIKLKRRQTMREHEMQVQQRCAELLEAKPLEPKAGELLHYEGQLKGWKPRHIYLEDRLPLCLRIYKRSRVEGDLMESIELDSDTVLEEDSIVRWGAGAQDRSVELGATGVSGSISSITSLKKTIKSSKQKENSFVLKIGEKSIRLGAETPGGRIEWVSFITQLLDKHHGLVHSLVPDQDSPSFLPPLPGSRRSSSGTTDSGSNILKERKKSKSNYSISEEAEEEVVNPLCDEDFLGQSFKNELFGQ